MTLSDLFKNVYILIMVMKNFATKMLLRKAEVLDVNGEVWEVGKTTLSMKITKLY